MKTKLVRATAIQKGDTLVRFGFPLKVLSVSKADIDLPFGKVAAIAVTHEKATVNYPVTKQVEILA